MGRKYRSSPLFYPPMAMPQPPKKIGGVQQSIKGESSRAEAPRQIKAKK